MSESYKIHEFAKLAGVTVKALRHYDRLGLLQPKRTEAGYRLYREADLERLEQILALKFIGVPLKQIKAVLERAALALPDALRLQRRVIEERQQLLARAIVAIEEAERAIAPGQAADPGVLRKIIEVMDMQNNIDVMKAYYSESAWLERRPHYEQWPSEEWRELFRQVEKSLDDEPAGDRAQVLAARWLQLVRAETAGGPEAHWGAIKAWADRRNWPPALRQRLAEFDIERIYEFMGTVLAAYPAELLREVAEALGENPGSARAQDLAARWMDLGKSTIDAAVHAGLIKACYDRRGRSAVNLDEILDFLGQAITWPLKRYFSEEAWGRFIDIRKRATMEMWQNASESRIGLYHAVEAALGEDPAGERAQALAARWMEMVESDACGDAGIKAGLVKAWADRTAWPDEMRRQVASMYMMKYSTILSLCRSRPVADFIDRAIAWRD